MINPPRTVSRKFTGAALHLCREAWY